MARNAIAPVQPQSSQHCSMPTAELFLFAAIAIAVGGTTLYSLTLGLAVIMLETAVSGWSYKVQAPGFADDPSLQHAFSANTSITLVRRYPSRLR